MHTCCVQDLGYLIQTTSVKGKGEREREGGGREGEREKKSSAWVRRGNVTPLHAGCRGGAHTHTHTQWRLLPCSQGLPLFSNDTAAVYWWKSKRPGILWPALSLSLLTNFLSFPTSPHQSIPFHALYCCLWHNPNETFTFSLVFKLSTIYW